MEDKVYSEEHTGSLMRFSARIAEAKEFWLTYEFGLPLEANFQKAVAERWFGNISEDYIHRLLRQFEDRFWCHHPVAMAIQEYFRSGLDHEEFRWYNHLSLLLYDRYYRFAAADYLPDRMKMGLLEISRTGFYRLQLDRMPQGTSITTATKYSRHCLGALTENGLLKGNAKKTIASPTLTAKTLALLLHVLSDLGVPTDSFDGSPFFRSLLKARELLLPIIIDGERRGYWEFHGDRNRIQLHLSDPNLRVWSRKVRS